ncbi:MAG TPA: MFS transporter [Thermoanaerobaculia bacterium]|jgi:MFS family permease|nr:MFS transporter [Thermoanaerobaculia bacterium]
MSSKAGLRKRWLNSTILGIGLASFCSDVGHEMATTALPALLATLGASSALLGLIEGLADGLSSFAKLASGLYSDRLRRRKPLAVMGYFVTASGMASFAFATQWWHVLLGRAGGWLGRGARSPVRNVLLTEATSPETYGRAFGLERAMDSAGAILGPALTLALVVTVGLHRLFLLTLIPGLAAALLIGLMVREKPHEPQPHVRLWAGIRGLPGEFKRYLVGVGVAGLGDFSNTLLILWATQAWTPSLGLAGAARRAMLFYIGYNVLYTLSCYVSGGLADRFPKRWVLATGYSLAVIPALALIFAGDSPTLYAVAFGFSGVYMGVWETVESATSAGMIPGNLRGTGFGVLATVNGIGDFFSSAMVGALWVFSPVTAMVFVILASLIGAAIIAAPPRGQVIRKG